MSAPSTAVAERDVELRGGTLTVRVRVAGSGPDLLYLHPEGGLAWDPFVQHLATRYTVHAPQFPGTTPGDPYAIHTVDAWPDLVLAYEELTRALGLDRPVLVGPSFGGMLAADLAAHFPALPRQLVLLDPVGLWRDDHPVVNWNAAAPDRLPGLLFHDPTAEAVQGALTMPSDPAAMRTAIAARIWALGCSGKFVWPIPDRGLRGRLNRIAVPTLLVWGRQDRIVDLTYAQDFSTAVPGSSVAVIEDCGHFPQIEMLKETVSAVEDFLGG